MTPWICPKCGSENTETPETVMAECSECGEPYDMPSPNEQEAA